MWTLETDPPPEIWYDAARPGGVVLACSTRRGGISAPPYHGLNLGRSTADDPAVVAENRRRLLVRLGLDPARLVTAGQVHGSRVERVSAPGHVPECDALVTTELDLALAVTTADCMSLLYAAPGGVAAAHSGWRGTADGMPRAALKALCEATGCSPDEVSVYLGPCIRSCCYEVGPEVAERFAPAAVRTASPRPYLDLPRAARTQLIEAGLPARAFHDCGACTSCDTEHYFSYRRDGPNSGRHWGVAARLARIAPLA